MNQLYKLSDLFMHMLWICSLSEVRKCWIPEIYRHDTGGSIQHFTEFVQTTGIPGYKDTSLCNTKSVAPDILWYQLIPISHNIILLSYKSARL